MDRAGVGADVDVGLLAVVRPPSVSVHARGGCVQMHFCVCTWV